MELDGTSFQKETWNILKTIPYGKTMTYGEIAKIIAANRNITKMSAQAVGNAISKNKISIIIPCHRVVGAQNKLVGYTGGKTNYWNWKKQNQAQIGIQDN